MKETMWVDAIVQEVRDAGGELEKRANYDLHTFFKNLRDNEKKRASKVISRYISVDKSGWPGSLEVG